MKYLAIKSGLEKGIYPFETKEEKEMIIKKVKVAKNWNKIFETKEEAMGYADTDKIINIKDNIKNNCSKEYIKDKKISLIETFLKEKENFDGLKIVTVDGNIFTIILEDLYYLNNRNLNIYEYLKAYIRQNTCLIENNEELLMSIFPYISISKINKTNYELFHDMLILENCFNLDNSIYRDLNTTNRSYKIYQEYKAINKRKKVIIDVNKISFIEAFKIDLKVDLNYYPEELLKFII